MALPAEHAEVVAELFNIGMGHAGAALSEMAHGEFKLSIPRCEVLDRSGAIGRVADKVGGEVHAVHQAVSGGFAGEIYLLVPGEQGRRLAGKMLGVKPAEVEALMVADALLELGNVVLSSCVGTLSNMTRTALSASLPEYRVGSVESVLRPDKGHGTLRSGAFFLSIDFGLAGGEIDGSVVFLVDESSAQGLRQAIGLYLDALG